MGYNFLIGRVVLNGRQDSIALVSNRASHPSAANWHVGWASPVKWG